MQLFLKIQGHPTFIFQTHQQCYSAVLEHEIKNIAQSRIGIPNANYLISSSLRKNDRLKELTEFQIHYRLLGGFNLYVKNLRGETHSVDVDGYQKIESLKVKVMQKFNVPPEFMRIIFAGKQLEDNRTIYDYNISKETTLHMVMRVVDNKLEDFYQQY